MIIAAALVIGLIGDAFARLGQTEEQVSALFGKPIHPGHAGQRGRDDKHVQEPKR